MITIKIIVEKHTDGYVAYPVDIKGVIVGEGNFFEEALQDVKSAIQFHQETFDNEVWESAYPAVDAFVAETTV